MTGYAIQKAKLPGRAIAVCALVIRILILTTIMIFTITRIIRIMFIVTGIIMSVIRITIIITSDTTQARVAIALNYLLDSQCFQLKVS